MPIFGFKEKAIPLRLKDMAKRDVAGSVRVERRGIAGLDSSFMRGYVAEAVTAITALAGSTLGTGTIRIFQRDQDTPNDIIERLDSKSAFVDVPAFNLCKAVEIGEKIFVTQDMFGDLYVTERCEKWITKITTYTLSPGDEVGVYPPAPGDPYPQQTLPPSPSPGDSARIRDGAGEAGTGPGDGIPVGRNGELIRGVDADFSININFADILFVFRKGILSLVNSWWPETGATGSGFKWTAVPFAHYKCNDDLATTVVIDSAGSNNGIASVNTNTLSQSPGLIISGKSLKLTIASSHKIIIDGTLSGIINDSVGTWMLYAEPVVAATGTTQELIAFADTNGQSGIYLRIENDGTVHFIAEENDVTKWLLKTDSPLQNGQRVHITAGHDGTNAFIFLDGKLVDQTFITTIDLTWWFSDFSGGNVPDNGRIGSRSDFSVGDFNFYGGEVDDVRIYRTDESEQIIAAIVNNGAGTEATLGTF